MLRYETLLNHHVVGEDVVLARDGGQLLPTSPEAGGALVELLCFGGGSGVRGVAVASGKALDLHQHHVLAFAFAALALKEIGGPTLEAVEVGGLRYQLFEGGGVGAGAQFDLVNAVHFGHGRVSFCLQIHCAIGKGSIIRRWKDKVNIQFLMLLFSNLGAAGILADPHGILAPLQVTGAL